MSIPPQESDLSNGVNTTDRRPVLTLLLLAPVCGELLSGSSPPFEFFNPVTLVILMALYGSGALLIREWTRRWRKGWPSIFVLGLAYGIYEEGIIVRSFFDPTWQDLDLLASYGRWAGVNWVWSFNLTLFHATNSNTTPIALAELIYPERRDVPWLGRRGRRSFTLLFLSLLIIAPAFGMRATPVAIVGCIALMILLIGLARRLPTLRPSPGVIPQPARRRRIGLLGFVASLGFFFTLWGFPSGNFPPSLDLLLTAIWPLVMACWILALGGAVWDNRQTWAFLTGLLAVWILFAFLNERGNGMALVGGGFIVFLYWLRRRICLSDAVAPHTASASTPVT